MLGAEWTPNGRNWRRHPTVQVEALQGILVAFASWTVACF